MLRDEFCRESLTFWTPDFTSQVSRERWKTGQLVGNSSFECELGHGLRSLDVS